MNKLIGVISVASICLVGCQQKESIVRLDGYRLLNTTSATSFANGFFRDLKAADGRALKVENYVSKIHCDGKRALKVTSENGAKTTLSFVSAGKIVAEGKDGLVPVTSDAKGVKSVEFDGSLILSRQVEVSKRVDFNRLSSMGIYLRVKDEAHVKEAKECGFDLFWDVPCEAKELLGWMEKYNLGAALIRPFPRWCGGNGKNAGKMRTSQAYAMEKYVAAVKDIAKWDRPAAWMVDICDEPSAKEYPYLAEICDYLTDNLKGPATLLTLYPNYAQLEATKSQSTSQLGTATYQEYIDRYCNTIPLDYITYDFYPIHKDPKRQAGAMDRFYSNFEVVAEAARKTGRDFLYTAQVNSHTGDGDYFTSLNQLRFQTYHAMAFGVIGMNWSCYTHGWWTNQCLTVDGKRTEQYDKMKMMNAEYHAWNDDFMAYRNVATHYANLRGQKTISAAGIVDLKTTENTALVAGEMVPWNEKSGLSSVLFVTTAGDVYDKVRSPRTLTFRTAKQPKVWTPKGEIALTRNGDTYSFQMPESSAVMISVK